MGRRDGSSSAWMSASVAVLVAGGALVALSHHGAVYRDRYRSLEDCRRDWGTHARDCEQTSTHGGGTHVYGPRYERGYRPQTLAKNLSTGETQVSRAGFGHSGARFGSGG
jgi:hypothetical protein